MKILFLHGWQSVPGGVKPTFLAQHGHEVINPKLPDEDFAAAVKIAQAEFDSGLSALALIEVGNDHRLADLEPLEAMLMALAFTHSP